MRLVTSFLVAATAAATAVATSLSPDENSVTGAFNAPTPITTETPAAVQTPVTVYWGWMFTEQDGPMGTILTSMEDQVASHIPDVFSRLAPDLASYVVISQISHTHLPGGRTTPTTVVPTHTATPVAQRDAVAADGASGLTWLLKEAQGLFAPA